MVQVIVKTEIVDPCRKEAHIIGGPLFVIYKSYRSSIAKREEQGESRQDTGKTQERANKSR